VKDDPFSVVNVVPSPPMTKEPVFEVPIQEGFEPEDEDLGL
jgi:hypothetical protein